MAEKKTGVSYSDIELHVVLKLTEQEARALHCLTTYGTKTFLDQFYKTLGKHYLKPLEGGIESLFETIKKELPPHFAKIDEVRKLIGNK